MDAATGTNAMFIALAAVLVATFGYAYARATAEPANSGHAWCWA